MTQFSSQIDLCEYKEYQVVNIGYKSLNLITMSFKKMISQKVIYGDETNLLNHADGSKRRPENDAEKDQYIADEFAKFSKALEDCTNDSLIPKSVSFNVNSKNIWKIVAVKISCFLFYIYFT